MRLLTANLPGTGGHVKADPDDFRVTEIPLYQPSGTGQHVYLYVEKRGLGAMEAAATLARAFGKPGRLVGMAGLKDARAVTRQWVSLEGIDPAKAAGLELPGLKVLAVSRHRNRLKIGHLAGNRFEVRVRGTDLDPLPRARAVLEVLRQRGLPNAFDAQRFGRRGDNHLLGRALVLGDARGFCDRFLGGPTEADSPRHATARAAYDAGDWREARRVFAGTPDQRRVLATLIKTRDPGRAVRAVPKPLARLLVSAYQAALFNEVLDRRLEDLDRVEAGDLAALLRPGARRGPVFLVEDAAAEQPRADRFEISPTGPLVAHQVRLAEGRPGEIERAVLGEAGVGPADFGRVKAFGLKGDRRPLRARVTDVALAPTEDGFTVAFTLRPGAYATRVLEEITKSRADANNGPPGRV